MADHSDDNKLRREAKEVVKERIAQFEAMPPLQKLKFADLVADEIVGAVIAMTSR